ncbi:MAG TPA: hypothetical protein VK844_06350 [Hyphomicrobiales bacterium]|nr:hypothetical protein [Hyphomicrobiales bacterium]
MMWNGYGGGFGFFWAIIYILVLVIPIARILGRIGFNQWWAAVAVIPVVNLVFLWVLAYADWPRDRAGV